MNSKEDFLMREVVALRDALKDLLDLVEGDPSDPEIAAAYDLVNESKRRFSDALDTEDSP